MILLADALRSLQPGRFNATIDSGALHVPAELSPLLGTLRVETGEQLVRVLWEYPSAFMAGLGWSVRDVDQARDELVDVLSDQISRDVLESPHRRAVGFGALPPRRIR